ncbi:copper resistance CopC/CopD family protein [Streptomyces avicenniae]|uniref:copper resistance CopC/CopD family protein n=1 Tax=Streptomyces avicenniae TaxID=500153 RepID=UPI00069C8007|nr:copper resistance protein CopC [Streptomyces avicenniae]
MTTPRRPTGPRAPARRAVRALLLTAAAAFAALLLAAPPAGAHAVLTGTDPEDGAVVAGAPASVGLTFSESVSAAADGIRVLAPDGERADTGDASGSGTEHGVALRDGLDDGTYTVTWHVVSADSHPISGAFTFSIGAPSASSVDLAAVSATGDDGAVGLLYDIGRYVSYGGFTLLVGSCVFALACWPAASALRALQRVTLVGWSALTAGTVALLLLRTPYTGTGDLTDVLDLGGLRDVVETRTGTALVTRLLLAAAAGAFIALLYGRYARLRTADAVPLPGDGEELDEDDADEAAYLAEAHAQRVRDLTFGLALSGAILAVGIAATWAMSEHASTGRQTGLAVPADIVHLLAVGAWLGGLVSLLVLLARAPVPVPRDAVRRFSAIALGAVAVLAVTGLYQSWRQVGLSWDGLTGTTYGQLLLVKVALVAVLVAVAGLSRRWTARLADRTADEAPRPVPVGAADTPDTADAPDTERARQLARQRAALDRTARRKARDADTERAGLRRSVLVETGIAAVLLAVTTALTAATPAHTAEETGTSATGGAGDGQAAPEPAGPVSVSVPYDAGGEGGAGTAGVELSPARTGGNTLHVLLTDPSGAVSDAEEIGVALTLPAEEIGPLRHEALHVDVGHWTVPDVQFPRPGDWELALTIRTSDIDQVTVTTTVPIG